MITRRTLLVTLAPAFAPPAVAYAKPGPKVIGVLVPGTGVEVAPDLEAFAQSMLRLGYARGKDFVIVLRAAEGKWERSPRFAQEMAERKVDLILAESSNAVAAAKRATTTISCSLE